MPTKGAIKNHTNGTKQIFKVEATFSVRCCILYIIYFAGLYTVTSTTMVIDKFRSVQKITKPILKKFIFSFFLKTVKK